MTSIKVLLTISHCCDRMKFLGDILTQARSLNLNDLYLLAVENLILDLMQYISAQDDNGLITAYDNAIDNILTLRDNAFTEWAEDVKNKHTPVPKTPIVVQE